MSIFGFRKYPVYIDLCDFRSDIRFLVFKLESVREFSLKDQLVRAVNSVILNLAEGCSRKHCKDFSKYISISIGSANEVVACIDICLKLDYLDLVLAEKYIVRLESIVKQLVGLR